MCFTKSVGAIKNAYDLLRNSFMLSQYQFSFFSGKIHVFKVYSCIKTYSWIYFHGLSLECLVPLYSVLNVFLIYAENAKKKNIYKGIKE